MAGQVSLLSARLRAALSASGPSLGNVLGLDVSTRVIGAAVLSPVGDLLATQALRAGAGEHPFRVAAAVSETVAELHRDFSLRHVGVEDVMKSFTPGRFHIQGLFRLASLNGVIAYESWRRTGGSVEVYMPNAIRASFGIGAVRDVGAPGESIEIGGSSGSAPPLRAKLRASADESVKVAVLRYVTRLYPDLAETWALTRTGTLDKANFDRADAILVALHGLTHHLERALLADGATLHAYAAGDGLLGPRASAQSGPRGAGAAGDAAAVAALVESSARIGSAGAASDDGAIETAPERRRRRSPSPPSQALPSLPWEQWERLHEQRMEEEAAAIGCEASAEDAPSPADLSAPAADGSDCADSAASTRRSSLSASASGDEEEAADCDGEARASPTTISPRRRRAPLFPGISRETVAALVERYDETRARFRRDFVSAFTAELLEPRLNRRGRAIGS